MKKRVIAWLLVLALGGSLLATAAFAGEKTGGAATAADQTATASETKETSAEKVLQAAQITGEVTAPVTEEGITAGGYNPELTVLQPDPAGQISFANVESRMREKNLNILTWQESIDYIDSLDYDKMENDLRDTLNNIANQQWEATSKGGIVLGMDGNPIGYSPGTSQMVMASLQQQYDAVKKQFDAIRNGDLQEDNAGVIRQLKNVQDQIILAGESTYIALTALETQEGALQRQLAALNRTVEELELRYQMGQVSALQLQQAKSGRTQLSSGLETLRMNIRNLKYQFEMMLGAEQTGEITLSAIPEVTEKKLAAMDLEKDLLDYKAQSYDLYAAAKKLEDEQEAYKGAGKEYSYNEKKMEFRQAKHNWQAAQYTYSDTVQNYELKFRTLYAQVQDYKQILDAAKVALECEKASCAASELRYKQGTISQNALLDARDSLKVAEEKVQTASNDLFSSYNTYRWAVEHGVLN